MKVILDMAMSINGIIARKNFTEDFLSEGNWEVFCKFANQVGCLIFGRKTYEMLTNPKEYDILPIKNVYKIIVSKNKSLRNKNKFFFVRSPKEALRMAKKLGFKEVLLAGGGNINSEFMRLGLVDEIFLNINSVIVNNGIRVFGESDFEHKLKLLEIKKLKEDILRLHYKVLK
ncbi:MAG: Bifunctional deaminase-reductase protein [archaeon GW2011_AR20]|nr:MAG: Bifunctional deaminase-reductase protein [archaeon GW2011_AR20]